MPARLTILAVLLFASSALAAEPRRDALGDPLPPGAVARFGSTRFRHEGTVSALAFSAEGKQLASADDRGDIRIWEMATGQEVRRLSSADYRETSDLAFSPDGKLLASADRQGRIVLWDVGSGKAIDRLTPARQESQNGVAFSPDGTLLAGASGGVVALWDVASGQKVRELAGLHKAGAKKVLFSPKGDLLAVIGVEHAFVFDPGSGKQICQLARQEKIPVALGVAQFSSDGRVLRTGDLEGTIEEWDALTGERRSRFQSNEGCCLAFSPDGKHCITANAHSNAWFTAFDWQQRRGWRQPTRRWPVACASFSPDGKLQATGSGEGRVRLWQVATGKEQPLPGGTQQGQLAVGLSSDGKALTTLDENGLVRLWDRATGKQQRQVRLEDPATIRSGVFSLSPEGILKEHTGLHHGIFTLSPDGALAVAALWNRPATREIILWDAVSGRQMRRFDAGTVDAVFVAISADHRRLAAGGEDGKVRVYDLSTGKLLQTLEGHEESVQLGRFAPDGRTLVTSGEDQTIRVWDLETGRERGRLVGHWFHSGSAYSRVHAMHFAADGKTLATIGSDDCVCLWDLATLERRRRFAVPEACAEMVALSPDGRTVLCGGWGATLALFDARSGRELARWNPGRPGVDSALFTADGAVVITAADNGIALAWDVNEVRKIAAKKDSPSEQLPHGVVGQLGVVRCRAGHRIAQFVFAPDGKTAAVLHETGGNTVLRLWDLSSGKELRRLEECADRAASSSLQFSANGKWLAAGDTVWGLKVWEVATGRKVGAVAVGPFDCMALAVAFAPDGRTIASCSRSIHLWDLESSQQRLCITDPDAGASLAVFSPDGKRLATRAAPEFTLTAAPVGRDRWQTTVFLWDATTGQLLRQFQIPCDTLAWTADHRLLALRRHGEKRDAFTVHDLLGDRVLFHRQQKEANAILSPDGRLLALAGKAVDVYDLKDGKRVQRIDRDDAVRTLAFSADGKLLATEDGNDSGAFRVWNVATGKELPGAVHEYPVRHLAYAPDGKLLAAASGSDILLWDPRTGKLVRRLPGLGGVHSLAYSPDGKRVAASNYNRQILVWDPATGKEVARVETEVAQVGFTPDGRRLVICGSAAHLAVWDLAEERFVQKMPSFAFGTRSLAVAPDGRIVAAAGANRDYREDPSSFIRFWRLDTGKDIGIAEGIVTEREKHATSDDFIGQFMKLRFTPDGKYLVSADSAGGIGPVRAIRVWETVTRREVLRIQGEGTWYTVTVAPDGRTIAVRARRQIGGRSNFSAAFFSLITGKEVGRLSGHEGAIESLAFSSDGHLASGSGDSTILLWKPQLDTSPRLTTLRGLPARKPEELWQDLTGDDAVAAYRAIWRLADDPRPALALVRKHVQPAERVEAERIAQLIAALDSKKFAERDEANKELAKIGEPAEAALLKVLQETPSLEVRRRVEALLEKLDRFPAPEKLLALRATMVLEQIANADAKRLLEELAKGAAEARLTREAKAALGRMKGAGGD